MLSHTVQVIDIFMYFYINDTVLYPDGGIIGW